MEEFKAWIFYFRLSGWGDWYTYTLASLVLYGVYQYCLDLVVTHRSRLLPRSVAALAAVAASTATVAVLSGVWLLCVISKEMVPGAFRAAGLGLLQGLLFLCVNLFRFRAREVFPQHIVLPVSKVSILLVILCSWFLFDELASVTTSQLTGFILIGLSIYLFRAGEVGKAVDENSASVARPPSEVKVGVLNLVMATVASAGIAILAKYAVGTSNISIVMFMFFSNFFSSLVAYGMVWDEMRRPNKRFDRTSFRGAIRGGLILGVVNLLAFGALLMALSLGNASVVIPMHSLYMIIPILIFSLVDGEKLTEKTTVAIILSVVSIMVLKS